MTIHQETLLLGGIEAGGTKYKCAVATNPAEPLKELQIPTGRPEETLAQVIDFFRHAQAEFGPLRAIGVGSFGPANIHPRSPGYGAILTTPKPGWEGCNIVESLRAGLEVPIPVAFDTDVNAAALAESVLGAGQHHRHVCYVTIGTGIGGGMLLYGTPLRGRMHPEIGHMIMPDFDREVDQNTNTCPFHASCLEGRASGPAMEKRWGKKASELDENHPAWKLEARYLAAAAINLTAAWSPETIIFGGGVSQQKHLFPRIRAEFEAMANGYWSLPPQETYIQAPALGQAAGITGALLMAQQRIQEPEDSRR